MGNQHTCDLRLATAGFAVLSYVASYAEVIEAELLASLVPSTGCDGWRDFVCKSTDSRRQLGRFNGSGHDAVTPRRVMTDGAKCLRARAHRGCGLHLFLCHSFSLEITEHPTLH